MNKNRPPVSTLQSTVDRKKDIITSGLISLGLSKSLRGRAFAHSAVGLVCTMTICDCDDKNTD